jgi:hypothetical protein
VFGPFPKLRSAISLFRVSSKEAINRGTPTERTLPQIEPDSLLYDAKKRGQNYFICGSVGVTIPNAFFGIDDRTISDSSIIAYAHTIDDCSVAGDHYFV